MDLLVPSWLFKAVVLLHLILALISSLVIVLKREFTFKAVLLFILTWGIPIAGSLVAIGLNLTSKNDLKK
jgi:hypothetical protein